MFRISKPQSLAELSVVKQLFLDYQAELGLDLCFQGFQEELDNLPGIYKEPIGCIFIIRGESEEIAGVVALKPLKEAATCEMKRLYVKPPFRKHKLGFLLVEAIIKEARKKGFEIMKLDTLEKLQAAISLYKYFGFKETKAYNYNPDETVKYFEKKLN